MLQGYSTLGSQWLMQGFAQNVVLQNAVVQAVAQEAGRDTAQVVLKWALQHGQVELNSCLYFLLGWSSICAEDSGQVRLLHSQHGPVGSCSAMLWLGTTIS